MTTPAGDMASNWLRRGSTRTCTGRVGVLVAWAWLGLHLFSQ